MDATGSGLDLAFGATKLDGTPGRGHKAVEEKGEISTKERGAAGGGCGKAPKGRKWDGRRVERVDG